MRISLELVPRSSENLLVQLKIAEVYRKQIDTVNIPDLSRFPLRSWEGCGLAKSFFNRRIPHIRAADFELDRPFPLTEYIRHEFGMYYTQDESYYLIDAGRAVLETHLDYRVPLGARVRRWS